ncbi:MAG: hypothetical protein RL172_636 [Bacteroidota bacterium]|jgi:6-phosphogluconolactonase
MKSLLSFMAVLLCSFCMAQKKAYLLVGTYTDNSSSQGIYVFKWNNKTQQHQLLSSTAASNPSFLAVAPGNKTVYAVNEDADTLNNGGGVTAYRFNKKKGTLTLINRQPSGGNHPCYVTVDKTGKWLFAGNYSSGNFSQFPLLADGALGTATNNVRHFGKGPNKDRQEAPHVHGTFLSDDNSLLLVPDLGIDKVMLYQLDATSGKLTEAPNPAIQLPGGSGPRHIALHPSQKYLYVVQELTAAVAAFNFSVADGKATLFQTISSVSQNYSGSLGSADIHVSPNGQFLYASNRGDANDLAIYSINQATGMLTLQGHQSTMGLKPRNFNFDPTGNFLLAANQESNNIVIFAVDNTTGLLTDTGKRIEVPKPVCIKWIVQ